MIESIDQPQFSTIQGFKGLDPGCNSGGYGEDLQL